MNSLQEVAHPLLVIDGSVGEGGGQILRSSLTLAVCLQRPIRLINIRKKRSKPGLLRQHLTCVRAAKEICGAYVEGDFLGSNEISFYPGKVQPGRYCFKISTAGSTCLVFQTVLLPLVLKTNQVSEIVFEGGTHNPKAPALDFITESFLVFCKQLGINADVELDRYGFSPAGGGRWTATVYPRSDVEKNKACVFEKNDDKDINIKLQAVSSNIPKSINFREIEKFRHLAKNIDLNTEDKRINTLGQGNVLIATIANQGYSNVLMQLGEHKLSAEQVAEKLYRRCSELMESGAQASEYLADQLMLPLALCGGGEFTTNELTLHAKTNGDVIKLFGGDVKYTKLKANLWKVFVSPIAC
ncbi:RNA 3'-terminal phosphate cyclase [Sessilibacter corallicola]|uniref:RNA 3'-terminal phosphate cyclase n=1 Tax=Sessilibacter corallicola TaxID=2904075 RepID=UPI001E44729A|nr:RNA 3'-terminal phosphate cyclase [Sessilibacter corallicola]MCE2026968.1 RNA 3'-phosphate cyclase [Sessilibacter corallicola]